MVESVNGELVIFQRNFTIDEVFVNKPLAETNVAGNRWYKKHVIYAD